MARWASSPSACPRCSGGCRDVNPGLRHLPENSCREGFEGPKKKKKPTTPTALAADFHAKGFAGAGWIQRRAMGFAPTHMAAVGGFNGMNVGGAGGWLFTLNPSRWCKGVENRKRRLRRRRVPRPTCGAEIVRRVLLFEIPPGSSRVCCYQQRGVESGGVSGSPGLALPRVMATVVGARWS